MEEYIAYIKHDACGRVTEINSSAFLNDTSGYIEIDRGIGDKYHHAQNHYFDSPLTDGQGLHNFVYESSGEAASEKNSAEQIAFKSEVSGEANKAQTGGAEQVAFASEGSGEANKAQTGGAEQVAFASEVSGEANKAQTNGTEQIAFKSEVSGEANKAQTGGAEQLAFASEVSGESSAQGNGFVRKATAEEKAAELADRPLPPPSEAERLRADIDFIAAMQGVTL